MAKGKGKKIGSGGPHKSHGPKKNMFRWAGPMKWQLGKTNWTTVQTKDANGRVIHETLVNKHNGILSKYEDFEAWQQACQAKGKRNAGQAEFRAFFVLTDEEKKAYFENLGK